MAFTKAKKRKRGTKKNELPKTFLQRRHRLAHTTDGAQDTVGESSNYYYVIEKLISKRFNEQTLETEYLVKWQNFSPLYNSWEPESELKINSQNMIDAFEGRALNITECEPLCYCREPYTIENGATIQCYHCKVWYHFKCINLTLDEANRLKLFYCNICQAKDSKLRTMYKH